MSPYVQSYVQSGGTPNPTFFWDNTNKNISNTPKRSKIGPFRGSRNALVNQCDPGTLKRSEIGPFQGIWNILIGVISKKGRIRGTPWLYIWLYIRAHYKMYIRADFLYIRMYFSFLFVRTNVHTDMGLIVHLSARGRRLHFFGHVKTLPAVATCIFSDK